MLKAWDNTKDADDGDDDNGDDDFVQTRGSQAGHYCYFDAGNSLLWRAVLGSVGCLTASLISTLLCR